MADGSASDQEKTEDATPKRREDARKDGQLARSQELTTAVLLLASALTLGALTPGLGRALTEVFAYGITAAGTDLDGASATRLVQAIGWRTLAALAALLGTMMAAAFAITAVQARGTLTTKPLEPKWSRISPLENGKRMVGLQPWAELFKALVKLAIVGLAVWVSLRAAWPELLTLGQQSPVALLQVVKRYAVRLLLTAGGCYVALALADYLYQLWQHEKRLRMSKEEIKQEYKQSEGDPMVKARRRSFARALARKQMLRDVPTADVIVANPTHIAIALRYDPMVAPAPFVVAMGERKVAQRIKQIAFDHGVPVIENRPLARALVASASVGQLIPAELYGAVAEILAFVIRQRAALGSSWKGTVDV